MTQVPLDTLFLQQAVRRGLMSLEHGRSVVDRARRIAALGEPLNVLELSVEGLPTNDAVVLRWLYSELKADQEGALDQPTPAHVPRSEQPTVAAVPAASEDDECPPEADVTIAPGYAQPGPTPDDADAFQADRTIAPGYRRAQTSERIGNYELLGCLGEGASATVYRARHVVMQNEVALKVQHEGADPHQTERFFQEARAATVLRHPNLVSVLDLGIHEGTPYLVMELVEGEPLKAIIQREGPLDALRAASYAEQIARGLEEAHKTLLHRDIKPDNIMIHGDTARLTDFGLVRRIRSDHRLTTMGDLLGSPAYMSPEQARGEVDLDGRCDVYGLGASLYEMLTARPPFTGTNLNEVLLAVIDDEPVRPSAIVPGADPVLELICLRCLAKSPEKRFSAAGDLADELGRFRAFRAANPL